MPKRCGINTRPIHSSNERLISCSARTSEPVDQRIHRSLQIRWRAAVLQRDQRRYQVAPGQIVFPLYSFVKQEVPVRRLVARQRFIDRRAQRGHVFSRRPGRGPAVQHHRQHWRQLAARPQVSATHEFLEQHPGIDEHANRHVPIHRGLKLELHYQVQPRGIVEAYPPQTVASALTQVVAHELRGQSLERAEVQPLAPPSGGESAQQIFDHPWRGEQALVGGILHGFTVAQPLPRQRRRLSRSNGANGSRFVGRCPMRGSQEASGNAAGGAFFRSDTVVKLRPPPRPEC